MFIVERTSGMLDEFARLGSERSLPLITTKSLVVDVCELAVEVGRHGQISGIGVSKRGDVVFRFEVLSSHEIAVTITDVEELVHWRPATFKITRGSVPEEIVTLEWEENLFELTRSADSKLTPEVWAAVEAEMPRLRAAVRALCGKSAEVSATAVDLGSDARLIGERGEMAIIGVGGDARRSAVVVGLTYDGDGTWVVVDGHVPAEAGELSGVRIDQLDVISADMTTALARRARIVTVDDLLAYRRLWVEVVLPVALGHLMIRALDGLLRSHGIDWSE